MTMFYYPAQSKVPFDLNAPHNVLLIIISNSKKLLLGTKLPPFRSWAFWSSSVSWQSLKQLHHNVNLNEDNS